MTSPIASGQPAGPATSAATSMALPATRTIRPLITEPMTVATDAALAVVCGAAAWDLAHRRAGAGCAAGDSGRSWSRALWAASLGVAAAAAGAGAIAHGAQEMAPRTAARAWRAAIRYTGVSGALFAAGAACTGLRGLRRVAALGLVALAEFAAQDRLGEHPRFRSAAAAYGINLTAGVACLRGPAMIGDRAALLACASAGVATVGGTLQLGGWGRHRSFNHNDRFHVVQIAASVLLYRAALTVADARRPSAPLLPSPNSTPAPVRRPPTKAVL